MARVVYIILAHSEPTNLAGLVASLWNPADAFEIWVDADCTRNLEPYLGFLLDFGPNIRVHTGRSMSWGGYSLIQTTLDAYAALEASGMDYSHAILASGTHVPLMNADEIFENTHEMPGWLDIATVSIPNGDLTFVDRLESGWARDILQRLRYRYYEMSSIGMFPVEKRDLWARDFIHKGSQWHLLRRDQVQFLLKQAQDTSGLLADIHVADELFIQNIICDSPLFRDIQKSELVFTDWSGASPRRVSLSEVPDLRASGKYLFARKVAVDTSIDKWIGMIRSELRNEDGINRLMYLDEKAKRYKLRNEGFDAALPELRRVQAEIIASAVFGYPVERASSWRHIGKGGSSAWLIGEPVATLGETYIYLLLFFQWGRGCTFTLVRSRDGDPADDFGLPNLPIPYGSLSSFSLILPDILKADRWWNVSTQGGLETLVAEIHAELSKLESLLNA
jgi:hypothetical protein